MGYAMLRTGGYAAWVFQIALSRGSSEDAFPDLYAESDIVDRLAPPASPMWSFLGHLVKSR